MELSRMKVLCSGLILQLLFTIVVPLPYNKYGRQCSDIGCLSSQVCVMAYDSCSLGQRENNECGRYPTCKKASEAGLAAGPSDNANDLYSNNPAPPKTAPPAGDHDVLTSLGLNPDVPNNRPAAPRPNTPSAPSPGSNPYANPYPALPPSQPQPASPYYPPGGAGNNYYGGGGSSGGSGGTPSRGSSRPGQYDGAGGNIIVPTQKPAAPSGGFFGGILSGVQNAVSNAVKQQIGTYINQRLGIGPAAGQAGGAGGLGSLFDARNLVENKNFGGLFSERKPAASGSAYPAAVEQRGQVYSSNVQPSSRSGSGETHGRQQGTAGAPPQYGWKLD